jgi:uncharacterized protein
MCYSPDMSSGTTLPPDPDWPRYTDRSFPSYRFLPGQSPHPRRDPKGHSYGQPEPKTPAFLPEEWWDSDWYLYGIDLYNFGYWWECHEVFESLWHAVGPDTQQGRFLQALIQVAAANLKRLVNEPDPAGKLSRAALERLQGFSGPYMGVNATALAEDVIRYFEGTRDKPALIRLVWPETSADL